MAQSLPAPATPTPIRDAVTPFSWPQFKSQYGLPSTPTAALDDSDQTDADFITSLTLPTAGGTYYLPTPGDQLRSYLLGDIGVTLPPLGENNFLDLEAGTGIGIDGLTDWIAPGYAGASNGQAIIVDSDNTLNSVTTTNSVGGTTTSVYGNFSTSGAWSSLTSSTPPLIPNGTSNYYGDNYDTIPVVSRSSGATAAAQWVPYIVSPGYYTIYAYFPSQNKTAVPPEPHITDAEYTITITLNGTTTSSTVTVNQQAGGTWIQIGSGPYDFPATNGEFTAGTTVLSTTPTVTITLDNTTANSLVTTIGTTNYQNVVVANAIKLVGEGTIGSQGDSQAARSFGTPVAVNITPPLLPTYTATGTTYPAPLGTGEQGTVGDYSEIALGYGGGALTGDGKTGGLPMHYLTDYVNAGVSGPIDPATGGPREFAGNFGYLTSLPTDTQPIDQAVYFTRTESVNTDPYNVQQSEQLGFLYCVNGSTGDVVWKFPQATPLSIGDQDTAAYSSVGGWGTTTADGGSFDNEAYQVIGYVGTGVSATATWNMPASANGVSPNAGRYFVDAYFPKPATGEIRSKNAHYHVFVNGTTSYDCYVSQQLGGQWVQLTATTGAASFTLTPGTSYVTLTNDDATGTSGEIIVADAIQFVPVNSMGSSDSTPAVVRNMRVWDTVSKTYISRSVVIAADNNGKVFCVDAAGNGDGNDVLYDSETTPLPVYVNSSGQAFTNSGFTTAATLPLHVEQYGTTVDYWIWQPNTAAPIAQSVTIDLTAPTPSIVTPQPSANWTSRTGVTQAYNSEEYTDSTVARSTGTPPAGADWFSYSPSISAPEASSGPAEVFVWNPGAIPADTPPGHVTDAEYTVVDGAGIAHTCVPIDQNTGTPGFVQLQDKNTLQTTFTFSAVAAPTAPTGFANTPDTIVLDNTTSGTPGTLVIADAVKIVFAGATDPNSDLIGPLAFQTCSPTVHVVHSNATNFPAFISGGYHYDYYDAKIYIGNTNGVLYALDGAGNDDGADPYQRDFSQDPLTPSPSVDWWFNVGVTAVDAYGEIEDSPARISQAIAGTPAYYSKTPGTVTPQGDEILFTTYSPQQTNEGTLYSVYAQGPVGDYGAGTLPETLTDYRGAAGIPKYNLSPIPYFSFPDAYGTLHLQNSITPINDGADHLLTSLTPIVGGITPPAHPLGDSAGSPTVYGGVQVYNPVAHGAVGAGQLETLPEEAYFASNDPTNDGSQPTEGRIWGVNLATGTVDNPSTDGFNSFVYPDVYSSAVGGAPTYFDPNIIPTNDPNNLITSFYNPPAATYSMLQFGPFTDNPGGTADSSLNYYVSSSPAIGLVQTIPNNVNGTLTDTLTGNGGYPTEYGGAGNAYGIDVPMLYVGDLDGVLHSINIAGSTDYSRYIQDATLDGTAIISTPTVLANGNGPSIGGSLTPPRGEVYGSNVGGAVFVTSQSGSIWESEAFPFIENGLGTTSPARNVDFEFGGPGGFSSVASASYNIGNFQFAPVSGTNPQTDTDTIASTPSSVDTSEWLYASGDTGYTYGFTANNSSLGNGGGVAGGFNPGAFIPPTNIPPDGQIPLNRNFVVSILSAPPTTGVFSPTNGRPPESPVFDWGQTVYIVIYGVDDPFLGAEAGLTPTQAYPKAITLTFSIQPVGATTNILLPITKSIFLGSPGTAQPITSGWPIAGYQVNPVPPLSPADPSAPTLGPDYVVYAYQLGMPVGNDPQTPGAKIQVTGINELVEYYLSGSATPVTSDIKGADTSSRIIREPKAGGGFNDVVEPGIDQETFSILNPLAIRGAAVSLDKSQYYDLTIPKESGLTLGELGPFCGIDNTLPPATIFALDQTALGNGNSVPETAPIGGSETLASGNLTNPNDPANGPGNGLARTVYTPVVVAVSPGMIGHGTSGNTSTPNSVGVDPTASSYTGGGPYTNPATPTVSGTPGPGDYGTSLLNVADRSALGSNLDDAITNLMINSQALAWQDNSGFGGGLSVVNPLPWDTMPRSDINQNTNTSVDYPNIGANNTSAELLPRQGAVYNSAIPGGAGSDTILTNSPGTLSPAFLATGVTNEADRTICPNPVMMRLNVPKYQPANLESFNTFTPASVTRFNSLPSNVAQGYIGNYKIYVDTLGPNSSRNASRQVQLWVSVPVDMSTSIAQPTIDIGSVPAGYGINLSSNTGTPNNDTSWTPFLTGFENSQFYQPITIYNNGNTNLINLHLNQYNLVHGTGGNQPEPNPFGSYAASGLSTIPSYDVLGLSTGNVYQPLLRSSLDDFDTFDATLISGYDVYTPYINSALTTGAANPPGPTVHKARVGDANGTIATLPDVPHDNLPGEAGNTDLNAEPYEGRPVVSLAVPLGTPAGTYSQSVSAFEGYDPTGNFTYQGPTYGNGYAYTTSGWMQATGLPGSVTLSPTGVPASVNSYVDIINNSAFQTESNPSTVVKVNVIEGRITDGPPQLLNPGGTPFNATLPYVDSTVSTAGSNDLQPWGFFDPTASTFGLLWSSGRNLSTSLPYSIFASGLATTALSGYQGLLNTPTSTTGSSAQWWTPAGQLTDHGAPSGQQSYGVSTFRSLSSPGVLGPTYALWVTETPQPITVSSTVTPNGSAATQAGSPFYTVYEAEVTYAGSQPTFGTPIALFTSRLPIYNPRASYYEASGQLSGFTPAGLSGIYPLVVYTTRVGGRSSIMYWPGPSSINGGAPAAVLLPAGVTSASTPTIVPRPSVTVGAATSNEVDLVFSGVLGSSGNADIYTARYTVTPTTAGTGATLSPATTLPTTTIAATAPSYTTLPTVIEPLIPSSGRSTWQARDVAWYRDPGAFQLSILTSDTAGTPPGIILIPSGSKAVYDRASGQWVFVINWSKLLTTYPSETADLNAIANWWTGAATASVAPNVIAYTNPANGTVTFSTALPSSSAISSSIVFQSLNAYVNPGTLRTTFQSQANTAPIAFIDDTYKPNAGPGQPAVVTSRYWYIYRKQTATSGNGAAATSVLYFNTRRLTLVLPEPIQLTYTAAVGSTPAAYTLTSFTATDSNGNAVTSLIDVDWARGRVYFPEQYTIGGVNYTSEGQTFTVSYTYTIPGTTPTNGTVNDTGIVTWQDEPLVNSPTQIASSGEHILPINAPANELDPSAFLDPLAGSGGASLTLNPSSVTPSYPNGQPYAHKVWVFWTSTRNAGAGGSGSDVYWETIDPRFEVINP